MVRRRGTVDVAGSTSLLGGITRGDLLGLMDREQAQRAGRFYADRCVEKILWTGSALEASLLQPRCTVVVENGPGGGPLEANCSLCGPAPPLCGHVGVVLMRWIDVRPTMLRSGPGTVWRGRSRTPFITLAATSSERVDLSHLTGSDLRAALELQLSLDTKHRARARITNGQVEIRIGLPSGDDRVVTFSTAVLPHALPLLRSLDRLRLDSELAELELSEMRLQPTLVATWKEDAIVLEPGYRLPDDSFLPLERARERSHGRWVRIGRLLCRTLDPDTPLLPWFRGGARRLTGRDALRFLNLDHPALTQKSWYVPRGALKRYRRPITPRLTSITAELDRFGKVILHPVYTAAEVELQWNDVVSLLDTGYARRGEHILRAPDLAPFERLGFGLVTRGRTRVLRGDRLAFMRLVAESDVPVTGADTQLADLARALRGDVALDPVQPPGLLSDLRPYQREGTAWLWHRHQLGIGALLADDMGLGKTHQIMGLLCLMQLRDPASTALVVCPRGVMEHWEDLLHRFTPHLKTHVYHGPGRSLAELRPSTAIVLTTYDIMVRSADELQEREWTVAVFDEAQRIKNPRTKAARAARRIPAVHRIALSGTPLENRLLELWSVIDLIAPGYLGSERQFRQTYRHPTQDQLLRLRKRLAVLTLRRVKEQVLSELPDKVEDRRFCQLSGVQRQLYEDICRTQVSPLVERLRDPGTEVPYIHIFALLTRLKQVCDHPSLVLESPAPELPSGKLLVFEEILDEALASGQQVVVFSQYVTMIKLLSWYLERRKIRHLQLTGSTRDRGRIIRRFNAGQHEQVLLASLLAGGVGVDLTGASVVIHYDRWWNPAKENQATDRVHRIGQKRFVQVVKLITRNTIEERIDAIIDRKIDLMERVVAPTEDVIRGLDRNELADLLRVEVPSP
ncbi:MAG: DEAD/DEAH box helicase [Acidobacteria bacterium]|nr:DEAD/DEAH box helicase [Acidobacteriota bacterium]